MTVQAHAADRRLVVLAVLGVVLALTAAMWTLAGCAPKAEPSAPAASEQKDGNGGSSAMDGQPVNWTMDSDCSMCHTSEAESATDPATCESCHGTLEDMAAKTADSTALTDDKGTTVNPHERPAGEKHEENPATCTDCHNNHSKDLPKDSMRYCAQCHHRGTFECGTCHELRERATT